MEVATGSYTGNGVDNRNVVTGLSFQPAVVFILRASGTSAAIFRFTRHSGDASNAMAGGGGGGATLANGIQAFNSDGFQIGSAPQVNNNTETYRWYAFSNDSSVYDSGSYSGNNTARTISTAIKLDFIVICAITSVGILIPMVGMRTLPTGEAFQSNFTGGTITTAITSFGAGTGFNLGTYSHVNRTGDNYIWFGWANKTGNLFQGTYTGNAADNRNIVPGDAFQPTGMWARARGAIASPNDFWCRHPSLTGDNSDPWTNGVSGVASNRIQAINSNGFQVGTDMDVNTETYHYLVFKHVPSSSPLAAPLPGIIGGLPGDLLPTAGYTKYKTQRQAVQTYNNLILGP